MQKQTGIVPRALRDRPTLTFRQSHYYGIYREIARSRQFSQSGALSLSVDMLNGYVDYFRIRELDEREDIFLFVGALDEVYCEISNKPAEPGK